MVRSMTAYCDSPVVPATFSARRSVLCLPVVPMDRFSPFPFAVE
jgi:hypothetical protein